MVSINSSVSGTAALRALQATSKSMAEAQTRISTGFKVNSASDNAAAWSAASQLRSTIKSNDAFSTGLSSSLTQAKLTTNALGEIDKTMREIRTKVNQYTSTSDTNAKTALALDISNLQKQVTDTIDTAAYNGVNWLKDTGNISISAGVGSTITITRGSQIAGTAGLLEVKDMNTNTTSLVTFGTAEMDDPTMLTALKAKLDAAITATGTLTSNMGSATTRIESRNSFLTSMNDIMKSQLSDLVDADLDEESAKLASLQVKQQLATTALSLINQSQMNILRLFQ